MKLLIAAVMAFALTGCAGFDMNPLVDVANSALDEPTIKSGMTSREAAYMATYKAYAKETGRDKPIVDIEGDGGEIKISGVKSIKVYGPSHGLQAPTAPKSALVEIMDSAGKMLERVFIPWVAITEGHQTTREASRNALESDRIQSSERQAITVEAIRKEPLVVSEGEVVYPRKPEPVAVVPTVPAQ